MWKPTRNACLGPVKHDWTSIVWQWAKWKHFLSTRGNVWNSKVVFYNNSTCLLKHGFFKEIYHLLLLFSIILLWWYQKLSSLKLFNKRKVSCKAFASKKQSLLSSLIGSVLTEMVVVSFSMLKKIYPHNLMK